MYHTYYGLTGKTIPAAKRTVQSVVTGQRWPVNAKINSKFGWRMHPIRKTRKFHTGLDLAAPGGTPIGAFRDGTVIFADGRGTYGNLTIIDHGNGKTTYYAHQSMIEVNKGDRVTRGQVIGRVGTTGLSTGNHLHFETRENGTPVDPQTVTW